MSHSILHPGGPTDDEVDANHEENRTGLRDILCTSCGGVAKRVDESLSAWQVSCLTGCFECGANGHVEQVDDGEQAMLVFRVES